MTEMTTERPDLGWPLKAWLGFVFLASLWVAYRLGMQIEDLVSHRDPRWQGALQWALPALLAIAAVQAISALLLFARLRLGLALYMLCAVAALVINLTIGVPLSAMAIGLAGIAVMAVLVHRRWHVLR